MFKDIFNSKLNHWRHNDWTEWVQKWYSKDHYDEETWFERVCKLCGIIEQKEVDDGYKE